MLNRRHVLTKCRRDVDGSPWGPTSDAGKRTGVDKFNRIRTARKGGRHSDTCDVDARAGRPNRQKLESSDIRSIASGCVEECGKQQL